jgi:hypothetical protein
MLFDIPLEELVRVAILPVLFVFFNGLAEIILSAACGIARDGRCLRVLYIDSHSILQELITEPSRLANLRDTHTDLETVIDVSRLATLNWWDYPSIPMNLCFAALTADAVAFFSPKVDQVIGSYTWLFPLHIFSLLLIILLSIVALRIEDARHRKYLGGSSLALGFMCAVLAFVALRSVL